MVAVGWLTVSFFLMLVALVVLMLAFEIWMFVDVIGNQHLSPEERAIWVVGMLLVHPFAAIAYYFMRRSSLLK